MITDDGHLILVGKDARIRDLLSTGHPINRVIESGYYHRAWTYDDVHHLAYLMEAHAATQAARKPRKRDYRSRPPVAA